MFRDISENQIRLVRATRPVSQKKVNGFITVEDP
jgi:hypothetical protein